MPRALSPTPSPSRSPAPATPRATSRSLRAHRRGRLRLTGASAADRHLTFATGETTKTITVFVADDQLVEVTETLTATLSTRAAPTIGADDQHRHGRDAHHRQRRPDLAGHFGCAADDHRGVPDTITFTVTRTGDAEGNQSVDLRAHRRGRLRPDRGQRPADRHADLCAGETTKTITVFVADDQLDEVTETLTATHVDPQGSADNPAPTISTATAAVDHPDNDGQTSMAISAAHADVVEGAVPNTITFTVTRTGNAEGNQSVDLRAHRRGRLRPDRGQRPADRHR